MAQHAFYIDPADWSQTIILPLSEVEHARVLRLKINMNVIALDGKGKTALCQVKHISKKNIELVVINEIVSQEPESKAIMALALSKAVRRGFFMEKAVELSAWGIWLWQADRSQVKLSQSVADSCKGQLIAGLKQCQNPWLPEVRTFMNIEEMIKHAQIADWRIMPWEELDHNKMISVDQIGLPGTTVYVIGPEGGFSSDEVQRLQEANFSTVSLGRNILRCETAASLCLGLHYWASQAHATNKLATKVE